MAEAHLFTVTVKFGGREERQHTQTTSEVRIQVVIAAALPPTLGAQSAEIANRSFIKSRAQSFGSTDEGPQVIDPTDRGHFRLLSRGRLDV